MTKNNKKLIVIILAILGVLILGFVAYKLLDPLVARNNGNNSSQNSSSGEDNDFILTDYPIEKVPLYPDLAVSSMKYFVNEDPTNAYDDFFDAKQNYYNVVFKADADKKAEVFDFYKSKMSSISQETSSDDTVEGVIDVYKISISNYGYEDYYLQVHLPSNSYSKQNKYYENYPNLIEVADNWFEVENTYGLLNQKGGQIEYSQWFDVFASWESDDSLVKIDPVAEYYKIYKEKYADKQNFAADDLTGGLTWTDGDYEISSVFSTDHGRVYLSFRKPMN